MLKAVALVAALAVCVRGHGHVTLPASTRNGGLMSTGGYCGKGQCFWFSNNVEIPGKPTLPTAFRSVDPNITGGKDDVFATSPWRSPGSAKVFGSGCGVAGGGPTAYANGGTPPPGIAQGLDGLKLPTNGKPAVWKRGEHVSVGWAISANHGGGYAYRLCKNVPGQVTEECFQKTPMSFVSNTSWIVYPNTTSPVAERMASPEDALPFKDACVAVTPNECGHKFGDSCLACDHSSGKYNCTKCCPGEEHVVKGGYAYCASKNPPGPPPPPPGPAPPPAEFPNAYTTEGTYPAGSQWKRDPVPGCAICPQYDTCGTPLAPIPGRVTPNPWDEQVNCYAACDGSSASKTNGVCPPGTPHFTPAAGRYSGFGKTVWPWSIVDDVVVPADIEPGHYLMSWRWDCEESTQVWQNCADINII